jgi:colicin import membrane protein
MAETTALAVIETINAVDLFNPEIIKPKLATIRTQVLAEAASLDISTPANRAALASLAYKVGQSKNFVDKERLALVGPKKKELKVIDQSGAETWDFLEALQKEVRKPLTDYENAEKERVARHEQELAELVQTGLTSAQQWETLPLEAMKDRLREIQTDTYQWEEFQSRAVAAVVTTIAQIKDAIQRREKLEADRAELERLRVEQAKRDQADREAQIAREATEKAEREAKEREERAAKESAEREATAVREKEAAEQRAARAVKDAEEAARKAERDKAAAVAAERVRQEQAAEAERLAAEKREANKRHCAKINREVRDALMQNHPANVPALTKEQAEGVIRAVAMNLIPYTKINY